MQKNEVQKTKEKLLLLSDAQRRENIITGNNDLISTFRTQKEEKIQKTAIVMEKIKALDDRISMKIVDNKQIQICCGGLDQRFHALNMKNLDLHIQGNQDKIRALTKEDFNYYEGQINTHGEKCQYFKIFILCAALLMIIQH
ncbi:hypothetical protein [Candidatus Deianiraea vastatrix]|uniref:Uncharacterized protein n=1 Tax=Candidatus Deianiraea vastatrix TaxID=2163644 RepID=A0A5B8XHM5_9RICK|nr:hypothetical protein [Candidatus Deianiraea vastatrix]QED23297.1 hypothetical protein Deia_00500 [Candidatus Deianiraea vastatrix]